MKRLLWTAITLVVAALTLAPAGAVAQQGLTTGSITGRVFDQAGSPLADATVIVRNTETGTVREATTGDDGRFNVGLLRPGLYTVRAEFPPLQAVEAGPVQVTVGEARGVSLVLQPVALEALVVTSDQTAAIDATQGGVVESIVQDQIEGLPTAGRDFTDFINLSGLISPQPGIGTGGQFSIGGARTSGTNIQIDGADANNAFFGENRGSSRIPFTFSLESIREFQIVTNGYDVEYGRFAGGLINAVTRGGTNDFSGSVFFFGQDDALTSNNFDGTEPTDFQSFQFGGTLSGPIIEDKLHFFLSGDFQERNQPTFALTQTRAGIPGSDIDEFVNILETVYGLDASSNVGQFDETDDEQAIFGRLDWQVNNDHRVTFRANYTNFENVNDRISPAGDEARTVGGTFKDESFSTVAELNSIFGNSVSNTLRAHFSYEDRPRPGNSRLPSAEVDVENGSLVYGGAFFGILHANDLDESKFQITDNLTVNAGRHTLKFGTDNVFTHTENLFWLNGNGFFTFDSLEDFRNRNPGFSFRLVPSGPDGEPAQNPQAPFAEFDTQEYSIYAQDEIQATDKLLLTLGVRYDYTNIADPAPPLRAQEFRTLIQEVSQSAIGRPVSTAVVPDDTDNIGPRFAFTYDAKGDESSLIRGGVGLFYGRSPAVLHGNVMSIAPDPLLAVICIASATPEFNYESWQSGDNIPSRCAFDGFQGNPFGIGITGAPEITVWDEDFEQPETWKANLGFEQRLGNRAKVGIQGIFSETRNNFVTKILELNPEQFSTADGRPVFVEQGDFDPTDAAGGGDRSRDPDLSRLYMQTSSGVARSWNVKLDFQGRPADNLRLAANYTWNYAFDNSSFVCCTANAGIFDMPTAGDPNFLGDFGDDLNGQWGPSDFQRRHVFVTNAIWQLPSDFDLAFIYRAQSGNPYTPTVSGDLNGDGEDENDRPFLPDPNNPTGIQFEEPGDLQAYQTIVANNECIAENVGRIIGRNDCTNPWWHRLDIKLRKGFETVNGQRLELVADLFNVLDGLGIDAGEFVFERDGLFRAEGFDEATNEVIVSVDDRFGQEVPVGFEPFQFRAQFGVRYRF